MPTRKYQNPNVYEYKAGMKSILATTRFNNQTWQENKCYLEQAKSKGDVSMKINCIYNCFIPISSNIPIFSNVIVLEMNNETNQIVGIGLLRHQSPEYGKYHIYSNPKYNQYTYQGVYHINRADMNEEELQLIRILEGWCFRGRRHLKRLTGIKAFPCDILYDHKAATGCDIVVEIANMFKTRFLPKSLPETDT